LASQSNTSKKAKGGKRSSRNNLERERGKKSSMQGKKREEREAERE
jgi:hypothetical protein